MLDNGKSAIWEPGEVIYEAGSLPKEAYLILEGYVNLETKDGLKLNRLGIGEIFGESSILLDVPRTVTARVCAQKLVAKKIPKSYFTASHNLIHSFTIVVKCIVEWSIQPQPSTIFSMIASVPACIELTFPEVLPALYESWRICKR